MWGIWLPVLDLFARRCNFPHMACDGNNEVAKKTLSERDICTKFVTPALIAAGWDLQSQLREEVTFTAGRVIVRGSQVTRGEARRADYVLYYKPGIPIAVIEVKDNVHSVGAGMQQALTGAESLDVPFAFSTNGDAFLEHDRTRREGEVEREIPMTAFPSPAELWHRYCVAKGLKPAEQAIITQDYHAGASGKVPRYYQQIAINRTMEAIAKGQDRILLVMATGTGKTYTAFQIIWRLWRARAKKRILFLADRNILVDQTRINDFKPFESAMTKIVNRQVDKSYEIYLALYQAVTGTEEERNIYKQFSPDFFDLIIVDECHRGSAAADSAWRDVLEYFKSATQIGMTATPKETRDVSNIDYFGDPLYTYSLRQGIEDGFLAPYKVVRIDIDKDLQGWRPPAGKKDKNGKLVEDRVYTPGSRPIYFSSPRASPPSPSGITSTRTRLARRVTTKPSPSPLRNSRPRRTGGARIQRPAAPAARRHLLPGRSAWMRSRPATTTSISRTPTLKPPSMGIRKYCSPITRNSWMRWPPPVTRCGSNWPRRWGKV